VKDAKKETMTGSEIVIQMVLMHPQLYDVTMPSFNKIGVA
jgi:hypothetical protein